MGVDVELYAVGEITDDEIAKAVAFIGPRLSSGMCWREDDGFPLLDRPSWAPERICLSTPSRLYGVGYERGDWPAIYGAIRLMQAAFPGRPIHYGGDNIDEHVAVTDESLAALWAHWLGPDGDAYRERARQFNAEQARRRQIAP